MNIFQLLFINPITNLLVLAYKLFLLIGIPYALGFAVILLTIFIRLILYPFISAQIKAQASMQKISPHMAKIKEKYKGDTKKQQEEMMKLYKEHGVNPAAGCLPLIIQLPVIWSLYSVLTSTVAVKSIEGINQINEKLYFPFLKIDHVWDTLFFGIPLFQTPAHLFPTTPLIILVPIITGVLQFIFSKMMINPQANQNQEKKENKEDFQSAFQTQSLFIFPIMIGFFAYTLPFGLSLYWNTFTLFGILQQYLLVGSGGLKPWLDKIKK